MAADVFPEKMRLKWIDQPPIWPPLQHIVAAKLAKKCEVQLAAIGRAITMRIDTFGSSNYAERMLETIVQQIFPLTPCKLISDCSLLQPIFRQTATFGHFGRTSLPWEQLDLLDQVLHEAEKIR